MSFSKVLVNLKGYISYNIHYVVTLNSIGAIVFCFIHNIVVLFINLTSIHVRRETLKSYSTRLLGR